MSAKSWPIITLCFVLTGFAIAGTMTKTSLHKQTPAPFLVIYIPYQVSAAPNASFHNSVQKACDEAAAAGYTKLAASTQGQSANGSGAPYSTEVELIFERG
jgi:hypothetical protein